eukprot:365661-Chlamydomonas_euryale.AAC.1
MPQHGHKLDLHAAGDIEKLEQGNCNTDAAIARLWQTVWDLTEGVLGCREYRSTSRATLSCPRLVARSVRPPSGTAGQWYAGLHSTAVFPDLAVHT